MPVYAAIDIGSNSLRMMVAEVDGAGAMRVLAQERQVTRLGASVFESGRISEPALTLVLEALRRMGETIRRLEPASVRAVATSATRDASNQTEFLEAAQAALGYPVEVISGREEARLIHLGVQARWPHPNQCVLIVDVGGGSAEVIIGDRGELAEAYSRPIGAVRLQQVFLKGDPPEELELRRMEEFIDEKLAMTLPALERYRVDRVIGTSATAAAVVCAVRGIPRASRDEADRQKATIAEVRRFYELAASVNLAARRELAGIGPRRAEIVVAGTGALLRVLESLDVPELYYSAAGLRDGLIADLASRSFGRNVPTLDPHQRRTIELLARKYEVGIRHARHVAMLAGEMFQQLRTLHGLDAMDGRLLEAAAYLLDAGHFVSDSAHHKHSYYVVANSDLEGFTNQERAILALLCRYHRKSMPKASHDAFQRLTAGERGRLMKLIPLIRAADALEESQEQAVEGVGIRIKASSVQVLVESSRTVDLEMWALERTSAVFEQVYGRMLEVGRA